MIPTTSTSARRELRLLTRAGIARRISAPKFVVLMPLRDRAGGNIGLVVYAFKVPVEFERRRAQILSRGAQSSRCALEANSKLPSLVRAGPLASIQPTQ